MRIFNIQQLFRGGNKRTAKWVSSLLFLFCLISFSNNVVAQQVVLNPLTASTATIQCAGGTTTITATVASGTGSYEYSLDNPSGPFGSGNTFSVGAGDHTIYVHDIGDNSYDNKSINISETPLTAGGVVASGKNWSCGASPGCNGTLTVNITGGKPDYLINVTGDANLSVTTTGNSYTFSDQLCAGTYHISVTDGCGTPVTVTASDYVVTLDNIPPSCTGIPGPEPVDAAAYLSTTPVVDTVSDIIPFTSTGGMRYVSTVFTASNSSIRNNLGLKLVAVPSGSGWSNNDTIKVEVSYDNGTTWGAPVIEVINGGTPADTWIPLNNNQQDIQMRVICRSGNSSDTYTVDHLYVRGTNPSRTIVTDGPSGCTDNFAPTLTTTHSDGPVTWYCTTAGAPEFSFTRTWHVSDGCNSANYPQRISVGTAPVITDPEDTIINYCHNQDVDIKAPVATDNCGILRYDWTMTNENNEPVTSGSCDAAGIVDYDFPQPVTADDSVFHITWTAVDNAGIPSDPEVQDVIIRRKMVVALDANIDDFCSGATVTFDVSVSGGSGLYSLPIITPTETLTDLGNGHVTFTTTALKYEPTALLDVVVNYTDLDNVGSDVAGGCTTGNVPFSSGGGVFTVHQKIVTNSISRNP